MTKTKDVVIIKITKKYEGAAKNLILAGLSERFGFLDYSLNQDLNHILEAYGRPGYLFLIGVSENMVACTGAITKEDSNTGRIERMSVKSSYRRLGLAKQMLHHLEMNAKEMGYRKLVLETNLEWTSAIELYKGHGYTEFQNDGVNLHFKKQL